MLLPRLPTPRIPTPRPRATPLLLLLGLCASAAAAWPARAEAEVRRCTSPDGTSVFTDRRCEDIGGIERRASESVAPGSGRFYRGGCARNLQDLVYEMTSAIDSRDTNRLASLYHWAGMSGRNGYGVMSRLDALAQRPLVDIVPVMPAGPDGIDGNYYPQTTVRQRPVALRVEQTLRDSISPSSTVFGLHQHFGCWWIKG